MGSTEENGRVDGEEREMKRENVGCVGNPWPQARYQFFKHVVMMGIQGGNLSRLSVSLECREKNYRTLYTFGETFFIATVDSWLSKIR